MIEVKEEFVSRKGKIYLLSREERGEVHEFIEEQLRKEYIRLSKIISNDICIFFRKEEW